MTTYIYKKIILAIKSIFIGTIIPIIVIILILNLFGKSSLDGELLFVTLIIWVFLNLGLIANIFHKLEINDNMICRKTFLSKRLIKWEEVSTINFKPLRKEIEITQGEKAKISINPDYQDFKKLCLQIEDILSKYEKKNIIPEELRHYFTIIKQDI